MTRQAQRHLQLRVIYIYRISDPKVGIADCLPGNNFTKIPVQQAENRVRSLSFSSWGVFDWLIESCPGTFIRALRISALSLS